MDQLVETTSLAEAAGFPRPAVWCGEAEADVPTVLYVYGGTFAMNRGPMHGVIADAVARNAHARVLMVDYRLAPEYPFPLAIEDVVATYKALLARGVPSSKLVMMGDTSGAGIALAALVLLRDEGAPLPAGFIALTPWVDLTMSGGSYVENIRTGRFASDVEVLAMLTIDYLQGADPRHPLASPVFGELSGLPETLIHAGADDILLDDARLLAEGLRRVGGRAHLHVWQGLPDTWQRLQPLSPQAAAALVSASAERNIQRPFVMSFSDRATGSRLASRRCRAELSANTFLNELDPVHHAKSLCLGILAATLALVDPQLDLLNQIEADIA